MSHNPRPVPPPPAQAVPRKPVQVPPSALIAPRPVQARLAPPPAATLTRLPAPPPRPGVLQTKTPAAAIIQRKLPPLPPPALGAAALQRRASPPLAMGARASAVIQRHHTLAPAKVMVNAPAERPWGGYPYAIVGGEPFHAQAAAHGVGGNDEFLTNIGGAVANVVAAVGGLSLRLSNGNDMAIEESNLTTRQPKVFYATTAIVTASNQALIAAGSHVRLQPHANSITIWTGWWSQKTLVRVTPLYNGGPDALPQNCNAVAGRVVNRDAGALADGGTALGARTAARIAPLAWKAFRDAYADNDNPFDEEGLLNGLALEYHNALGTQDGALRTAGANRYAKPNVGQGYMTATIGMGPRNPDDTVTVRDHATNTDRNLGWTYHFAGVVARSGADRVTLENYARGDRRENAADPRWYFQMYGEQAGQSFHEFSSATGNFANPVTVTVDRNSTALPLHRQG